MGECAYTCTLESGARRKIIRVKKLINGLLVVNIMNMVKTEVLRGLNM